MSQFLTSAARFSTLAATALALATPALAETAQLRFDDLDMTSPAGKAAFERRANLVVIQACGDGAITGTRIPDSNFTVCARDVRRQIDQHMARLTSRLHLGG